MRHPRGRAGHVPPSHLWHPHHTDKVMVMVLIMLMVMRSWDQVAVWMYSRRVERHLSWDRNQAKILKKNFQVQVQSTLLYLWSERGVSWEVRSSRRIWFSVLQEYSSSLPASLYWWYDDHHHMTRFLVRLDSFWFPFNVDHKTSWFRQYRQYSWINHRWPFYFTFSASLGLRTTFIARPSDNVKISKIQKTLKSVL